MRKDTRFWITVPASLSLAFSAAALAPALAQATEWQSDTETQSQQQQTSSQSSEQRSEALNQLAEQHSDISDFVKAVEKAGMGEALTGDTKYTVFAPTNDALSDSDIKDLMESDDPQDRQELVNLLRSHMVADDVDPEMARTIGTARAVSGGEIELSSEGDTFQVAGNEVVESDIQQGNLRVYAIDGVLEASGSPTMAGTGSSSDDSERGGLFGGASESSGSMASVDFDDLDEDGDGYLSEEELQNAQHIDADASEIDQDQDGRISRTEFAAFEQMHETSPSASDTRSSTDASGSSTQPENQWEQDDWQTDDQ